MSTGTLSQILEMVAQLDRQEKQSLLSQLSQLVDDEEGWALEGEQLAFMLERHGLIEYAYENDELEQLVELAKSPEYIAVFGDMPWDEAYDRYEETWFDATP